MTTFRERGVSYASVSSTPVPEPMPYTADDAAIAREKAEFYDRHPDWTHRRVFDPREGSGYAVAKGGWVGRLVHVAEHLLEAQNGMDIDDAIFPRPCKIDFYCTRYAPPLDYPTLLLLGVGVGREVVVAREYAYALVDGQTLGPRNVAFAKENFGLDLRYEDAHVTSLPTGTRDAIIGCQVLEHSWSPLLLLIECARLLRPGGVCVMETPPAKHWTMGNKLHHTLCPTPRQAIGLFLKAGFPDATSYVCGEDLRPVREDEMDRGDLPDIVTVGHRWTPNQAEAVEPRVREMTT